MGAAGITTSTYPRPAKNKKAAAIQIMVMTMLVCAAVIGMAGKWWTDQPVYSWHNIQTRSHSAHIQGTTPNAISLSVTLFPAGACQWILPGTD